MKRLDSFMLKSFLPLFAMTFFICTFIVLMQFLWLHLNDLVGKGVGVGVMAELFSYAFISMVPMALPLAVLLASLMTFGNLGESLELTALKAGGVSLFRVMRPLIVLMGFVAVGAFFFQNNVLPIAQTRMWVLLKSIKQQSPELDIVEGEFNYQLPNINIYVESKNRDTGVLYRVMIYDFQQGFQRSRVILADSATLISADDKTHLYLTLHSGELFENLRDATGVRAAGRNQLYRREEFTRKELTINLDMNFELMDENEMRSLYIGKNVAQLRHSIDSLHTRIDSLGANIGESILNRPVMGLTRDKLAAAGERPQSALALRPDSLRLAMGRSARKRYIESARSDIDRARMEYLGRSVYIDDENKVLRRHGIEMHKKFTLSLACLVFFFIGAPLGAIIRKGGLGTPLVISVFLFIVYYIIDNTGYKMARDGVLPVVEGIWLSSAVLLPLGIFVTYKAVHDSAVFNADAYKRVFLALTGRNRRSLGVKEVVIEDMEPARAVDMLRRLDSLTAAFLAAYPRPQGYAAYWRGGYPSSTMLPLLAALEHTVSYVANTRDRRVVELLDELPVISNFAILHPDPHSIWTVVARYFFPVGLVVWLLAMPWQLMVRRAMRRIRHIIPQLITLLDR